MIPQLAFPESSAVPQRKFRIGRSRTGLGLFAVKPFKKREYIATYRGRLIPNAEAERREARGARYMFEINSRWTLDGSSRRNHARYVNHSCRPNAEAIERKGHKIVYVALRKIAPDQEITVHYGPDYFDAFITRRHCKCTTCRLRVSRRRAELRRKAKRRVKALRDKRKQARTTQKRVSRTHAKRTPVGARLR